MAFKDKLPLYRGAFKQVDKTIDKIMSIPRWERPHLEEFPVMKQIDKLYEDSTNNRVPFRGTVMPYVLDKHPQGKAIRSLLYHINKADEVNRKFQDVMDLSQSITLIHNYQLHRMKEKARVPKERRSQTTSPNLEYAEAFPS